MAVIKVTILIIILNRFIRTGLYLNSNIVIEAHAECLFSREWIR